MARNAIQFQKGLSLPKFLEKYGTEAACREELFKLRWPDGFRCPECENNTYCELKSRPVMQCHRCHHQTSLTARTLFEKTKLPLTTWFLAIFLLTQSKSGLSAMALARHLGVSYNSARLLNHKIMQTMRERDDSKPLTGSVQVDDAFWGGERRGGKRGRGAAGKTPFVAAVACSADGRPLAMRMTPLQGFRSDSIDRWARQHLAPEAEVTSDGLPCFRAIVETCPHWSIVTGGGPASVEREEFTWVNTMLGNVKNAIHGTYHAIAGKHLGRYLGAFAYRFNRRFELARMIERFVYVACRTAPLPYRFARMAEIHT
ncbi:MAG: IS1595 family transposase [Wenzhouxiangella sp.]